MRKKLYVDGVDLSTFGVYISGAGTYSAPEKSYNWYEVPGANGALLGYERRLQTIDVSYPCGIYTNFEQNVSGLRNFLLSRDGLVRISDTYHAGEFRRGVYAGPFEPTITRKLDAGEFVLTFTCQPQRWLTSGETPVTVTGTSTLTNPTLFDAKPLLLVTGYGTVSFGGVDIEIADYGESAITIDCETMNAYTSTGNKNGYVGFKDSGGVYGVDAPDLAPGTNTITVSGSITSVDVTPRWWEV